MSTLYENKVDFEVVFVGNKKPNLELPKLRFIYSEVKPAQCHQIAVMEAKGQIVGITSDDAIYPVGILDAVEESMSGDYCLMCDTIENGRSCPVESFKAGGVQFSPFAFFLKSTWERLGGYDNRYLTGQFENDFCLRLHADCVEFKKLEYNPIVVNHITSSQFSRYHDIGRIQLRYSWSDFEYKPDNDKELFKLDRNDELHPYTHLNILTKSQGVTNPQWK